jgi:hypothetical protein
MISANTSVTVTATPATAGGVVYSFAYWQKGDERITTNPYTFNINAHIPSMQAVFTRVVEVSDLSDGAGSATSPTLRYALTNAVDGDTIRLTGVNAGVSTVSVSSVLPEITKSVTIEGNGVVLTRTFEGAYNTQLLRITGTTALVNISRVHFKDGRANDYGAGIYNNGTLTLESCIFSGNQTSTTGTSQAGAINNNSGDLTIRGCTFYGNSTGTWGGGAIYVQGGALTLTGNLFYGNTGGSDTRAYPVVNPSNRTVTGSYNVVDVALGASTGQAGWAAGTGDTTFTDLSISGVPIDTTSFAPVNNAGLKVVPSGLANFPATYFNGTARTFPGAPGAVAAAP